MAAAASATVPEVWPYLEHHLNAVNHQVLGGLLVGGANMHLKGGAGAAAPVTVQAPGNTNNPPAHFCTKIELIDAKRQQQQ